MFKPFKVTIHELAEIGSIHVLGPILFQPSYVWNVAAVLRAYVIFPSVMDRWTDGRTKEDECPFRGLPSSQNSDNVSPVSCFTGFTLSSSYQGWQTEGFVRPTWSRRHESFFQSPSREISNFKKFQLSTVQKSYFCSLPPLGESLQVQDRKFSQVEVPISPQYFDDYLRSCKNLRSVRTFEMRLGDWTKSTPPKISEVRSLNDGLD